MEGLSIHPKAEKLATTKTGSMVVLDDGSLLTVDGAQACFSRDDGRTWETRPIFGDTPRAASWECALLRTASGAVVLVYMDASTKKWGWDNERHEPIPDARMEVWTTRSLDEGRTWSEPQRLFDGWCGAIINIIQTRAGRIVVPVQRLLYDPGRHAQATYVSDDDGRTWTRSNIVDFGGHGHHDGCCEGTVVELRDGRLWMLLRTNLDRFWQAFSEDGGLSWRVLKPTDIDASSAPGYLTRLGSGRLVLAWNRLFPEGLTQDQQDQYPRRGGDCNVCDRPAVWHRQELSVAFSEDDGGTWTEPEVVMRWPGKSVAYPFILERRPGVIWVMSRFTSRVGVCLQEENLV